MDTTPYLYQLAPTHQYCRSLLVAVAVVAHAVTISCVERNISSITSPSGEQSYTRLIALSRDVAICCTSTFLQSTDQQTGSASAATAAAAREPAKPIVYPTKEAAKEAFKNLLADFDVPAEASWDNAMRLVIHDPRYGALKAMGEKKSAFNEYCTVRAQLGVQTSSLSVHLQG